MCLYSDNKVTGILGNLCQLIIIKMTKITINWQKKWKWKLEEFLMYERDLDSDDRMKNIKYHYRNNSKIQ